MIKNLGLIPARANSVRCPGKNTADLGGRALIEWTILTALKSGVFDTVAVTTNDPVAKEYAIKHNCTVIDRSDRLSQPDTPSLPVVRDVLDRIDCETVMLLQPTSPFRLADDIRAAYALFAPPAMDSLVSVTKAPEMMAFEIGHARRLRPLSLAVVENGAMYLSTSEHLQRGGTWYDGFTYAYYMDKDRSLNIDTQQDLEIARTLVGKLEAA